MAQAGLVLMFVYVKLLKILTPYSKYDHKLVGVLLVEARPHAVRKKCIEDHPSPTEGAQAYRINPVQRQRASWLKQFGEAVVVLAIEDTESDDGMKDASNQNEPACAA